MVGGGGAEGGQDDGEDHGGGLRPVGGRKTPKRAGIGLDEQWCSPVVGTKIRQGHRRFRGEQKWP